MQGKEHKHLDKIWDKNRNKLLLVRFYLWLILSMIHPWIYNWSIQFLDSMFLKKAYYYVHVYNVKIWWLLRVNISKYQHRPLVSASVDTMQVWYGRSLVFTHTSHLLYDSLMISIVITYFIKPPVCKPHNDLIPHNIIDPIKN